MSYWMCGPLLASLSHHGGVALCLHVKACTVRIIIQRMEDVNLVFISTFSLQFSIRFEVVNPSMPHYNLTIPIPLITASTKPINGLHSNKRLGKKNVLP